MRAVGYNGERAGEGVMRDLDQRPDDAWPRTSRRALLRTAGTGFGLLGLAALLADEAAADGSGDRDGRAADPLAARRPHHTPRARHCIFLYMPGGPSHV